MIDGLRQQAAVERLVGLVEAGDADLGLRSRAGPGLPTSHWYSPCLRTNSRARRRGDLLAAIQRTAFSRLTISMAACAASVPLTAMRTSAWSSSSVVSTAVGDGHAGVQLTSSTPRALLVGTISKW